MSRFFSKKRIAHPDENDQIAAAITLLESKGYAVVEFTTEGVTAVAAERRRQIQEEGFSAEHDKHHVSNALLYAALCYLDPVKKYVKVHEGGVFFGGSMTTAVPTINLPSGPEGPGEYYILPRQFWPFEIEWWKPCPHNRVREIVKGLALGVAHLDQQLLRKKQEEQDEIDSCCGAL